MGNNNTKVETKLVISKVNNTLLKNKKVLFVIALIVILSAVVFIAIYVVNKNNNPPVVADNPITIKEALLITRDRADALASTGNKKAALEVYDKAIGQSTKLKISDSNNQKYLGNLYYEKAIYAFNENELNKALESVLKANVLINSENTNKLTAYVYEKMGNKKKAAEYYQITAALVDPNVNAGPGKQYYLDKAKEASGL